MSATGEALERLSREGFAERYARYLAALPGPARRIRIATTPLFLETSRWERLCRITEKILALLRDERYQAEIMSRDDAFAGGPAPGPEDYFGCVDFHLDGGEEMIIEVNWFPPGLAAFAEPIERAALTELLPDGRGVSAGFTERLIASLRAHGARDRVAIMDENPAAQATYAEFLLLQEMLAERGLACDIRDVREATAARGGHFLCGDKEYDLVFNRLIPSRWEEGSGNWPAYTAAYRANPNLFFINPRAWRLGDKRFLVRLCAQEDAELRHAVLRTVFLGEYPDAAALLASFGGGRHTVLKPVDAHAGLGVIYRPSRPAVERLFQESRERYLAQELFPAGRAPYLLPDGARVEMKFDVRVIFLRGEPAAGYARFYEGAITNFRGANGGLAPIALV